MLIGTDGVYSYTFEHEKKPDCPVCGGESLELSISSELTVEGLIEMLTERQNMYVSPFPFSSTAVGSFSFRSVDAASSRQSNKKAVIVYANDPDLLPSASTTGSGHTTKPGEEGLGVGSEWGRGHRHGYHAAVQLISPHFIRLNYTTPPFRVSPHPRIHVPVSKVIGRTQNCISLHLNVPNVDMADLLSSFHTAHRKIEPGLSAKSISFNHIGIVPD